MGTDKKTFSKYINFLKKPQSVLFSQIVDIFNHQVLEFEKHFVPVYKDTYSLS